MTNAALVWRRIFCAARLPLVPATKAQITDVFGFSVPGSQLSLYCGPEEKKKWCAESIYYPRVRNSGSNREKKKKKAQITAEEIENLTRKSSEKIQLQMSRMASVLLEVVTKRKCSHVSFEIMTCIHLISAFPHRKKNLQYCHVEDIKI